MLGICAVLILTPFSSVLAEGSQKPHPGNYEASQ